MKPKLKYRPEFDKPIFIVVLGLIIFGLIAVSSASSVLSFERYGNNTHFFFRQLEFAAAGLAVILAFSRVNYRRWRKYAGPIFLAGLFFLALVLLPKIGFRTGNTRSWFSIGPFLIQPSEFVKLAAVFYLAAWFEKKEEAETNFWFGILSPLLAIILAMGLVILEPDIGTASVYAIIAAVVFLVAGVPFRYLLGFTAAGFAALWVLVKAAPYRAARIITFLDPTVDPQGIGYHINQALLAIGSGGFWGYGFGNSRQKHNYLPETIGDSIFAVMAEELGFIRIIFLVLAFAAFGFLGLRLASRAPDKFAQLVSAGITGWIVFQALLNIAAISRLVPLTGIPLPFVSYGGSSLLSFCAAAGVLLNISRQRL